MYNKYTILRVHKQTAQKLKILAAMQHESMIALMDRLIAAEWMRLQLPCPPRTDRETQED